MDKTIEDSLKLTSGSEPETITEFRTDMELNVCIDVNKVKTFVFVNDDENYVVDFDRLVELGIVIKE